MIAHKNLLRICFLIFIASQSYAADMTPYHYQPEPVTLSGILVREHYYGSPNYGENPESDSKEDVLVLLVDTPISVSANHNDEVDRDSFYNMARIQIVPKSTMHISPLIGTHVTVKGTLSEGITAHHHTQVLIPTNAISKS